ncbi:MAG: hypothetical protein FWB77_05925 [Treponema sp.]|nr:hypothetical protein [Treponema sp.]
MKKLVIVLLFIILVAPVFSQVINNNDEKFYCINVSVEKIYPSHDGYIVQYRAGSAHTVTIGIPNQWFTDAASSAELVKLPLASDWPTMSVFYKEGEFSHLRIYVHPAKSHWTWGSIPMGTDVSRFFIDKESFKLKF